MAISKAMRAEIMRRDNYCCRYCGGRAPDVRPTIDHVTPVALGGQDIPENLVTACADCNAGKAAIPPHAQVVADVSQDALRWARAREEAAAAIERNMSAHDNDIAQVMHAWITLWEESTARDFPDFPADCEQSVARWLARGLSVDVMKRLISVTIGKYLRSSMVRPDVWPYFAGCCWRQLTEIEDAAKAILAAEGDA